MANAPFIQHFFVAGKYLGAAMRDRVWVHAEQQSPRSFAFICPVCGDAWAKCPVEPTVGKGIAPWQALLRCCSKHQQSRHDVPGSLALSWDDDFTQAFPEDVVRWEFQRHIALYTEGEI